MSRWEPDAVGRLRRAAMELYDERGYEETTVAEIAARAGLTERTYFRHFADKREVLFHGSEELLDGLVAGVEQAPPSDLPLEAIEHGLSAIGPFFDERRPLSRQRDRIIRSSAELRERERTKLGTMVGALVDVLVRRGVDPATAALAAETGITVFHLAFQRWLVDPEDRAYGEHVDETLASLRQLTAV